MKVSPNAVLRGIPNSELEPLVVARLSSLKSGVLDLLKLFAAEVSPASTLNLEKSLFSRLLAFAKDLIEQLFNSLASDPEDQPAVVNHRKNNHRRIEEATPRDVVTRFGKLSLFRSRYRRGRSGKTIFPLEIALGLQRGFTPAAANTVGRHRKLARTHDRLRQRPFGLCHWVDSTSQTWQAPRCRDGALSGAVPVRTTSTVARRSTQNQREIHCFVGLTRCGVAGNRALWIL